MNNAKKSNKMCAYFKACNYPDKPDSTAQDGWLGFDMEE